MSKLPKPGIYEIEVDEVLKVNESFFAHGSEDVIVKDKNGRTWAIPEVGRLTSRYDVKKGMKLKLIVAKVNGVKEITDVAVIKSKKAG